MTRLMIRDLEISYVTGRSSVPAVEGFNLTVEPGEFVGLAGESGSGKSTVAKAVMRILQAPGWITEGEILWGSKDILRMNSDELRGLRWSEIAMVFQSALESLNPVLRIEAQFQDMAVARRGRRFSEEELQQLMSLVDLSRGDLSVYPHQLSGGMRQRVGIALALSLRPKLLILDEPTTALDVVVQRNILVRLQRLREEMGFSVLFITHDLPVLFAMSDKILIMKQGRVCDQGSPKKLRAGPSHPYAYELLSAMDLLLPEHEAPDEA